MEILGSNGSGATADERGRGLVPLCLECDERRLDAMGIICAGLLLAELPVYERSLLITEALLGDFAIPRAEIFERLVRTRLAHLS